jgi:hypothetical protein
MGAQAAVLELPRLLWRSKPREEPQHPSKSLDELLRAPWAAPRYANPELVKIMGFVRDEVGEASRLRARRKQLDPAVEHDLKAALETADITSVDRGWEVWGALKRLNLLLGDRSYISGLLEHERGHVHDATHWHTWDQHFERRELQKLLAAYRTAPRISPSQRATAIDRLTSLYKKRAEAGRNRRTRAAVKERYLNMLAPVLVLLVVCLGVTADMSSTRSLWREFAVAACAGALGSTLSGVLKLRDRLVKLDDLRAFRAAMRVQPCVGASAGALMFIVLSSHAIVVKNLDPAIWSSPGLLGFAAGFSEPFFIGLVDRVAVIPDKQSSEQPATQPSPAAPKRRKQRR